MGRATSITLTPLGDPGPRKEHRRSRSPHVGDSTPTWLDIADLILRELRVVICALLPSNVIVPTLSLRFRHP